MKHLIKSDGLGRAWCKRLGCSTSVEGGGVREMTSKQLREIFFSSECPSVTTKKLKMLSGKKAIPYLIKYAEKEIKSWRKLIIYWSNV